MKSHIQKWGNSLVVRIPIKLAKQLQLHAGTIVNLEIENGRIIIQSPKYNLEDMLKNVTKDNKHHLMLEDELLGNEEW